MFAKKEAGAQARGSAVTMDADFCHGEMRNHEHQATHECTQPCFECEKVVKANKNVEHNIAVLFILHLQMCTCRKINSKSAANRSN